MKLSPPRFRAILCTPGLFVAAKALLDRNPDPSETEIRYWLAGNLCRCTGYDKIVRAVVDAAAGMRGAGRARVIARGRRPTKQSRAARVALDCFAARAMTFYIISCRVL